MSPARLASALAASLDVIGMVIAALIFAWDPIRLVMYATAVVWVLAARGHYVQRLTNDLFRDGGRVVTSLSLVGLGGLVAMKALGHSTPNDTVAEIFFGSLAALLASRAIGQSLLGLLRSRGMLVRRTVVVGLDEAAGRFVREVALRPHLGLEIVETVHEGSNVRSRVSAVLPDLILVSPDAALSPATVSQVRKAAMFGARVLLIGRTASSAFFAESPLAETGQAFSVVRVAGSAHPALARRFKRLLDVVVAGSLLVLLAPVLAIVAAAVVMSSPGPALFRQERVGEGGERFELLKFRSMRLNKESDHEWVAGSSGSVTRIGRTLRRSGLDELPQLVNVVRGDMSLVGPRPERPVFAEQFAREVPGYADRLRVPAGLVGLAQVAGLRGDTSIEERVRLDNLYCDSWSFSLDIKLLHATLWGIVRQTANAELSSKIVTPVPQEEQALETKAS